MAGTTYYAIALVVTIAVALTLAGVAWRRRSIPGGTYFALMMLSGAWWAFSYAMEALSKGQSQKIIWVQLSNLGDGTMPVFFMLFALCYWRPDIRIQLKYQIMLWLIPVATIIIALTNGLHGFLWSEITPSVDNPNILIFEHGPWFYVSMTYYYLTLWIGVVFLFRAATSLSRIYRRQALIVLVAAVIPWIANALFLLGFSPVHGLDIAPIMASATGLLLAFGIVKFQLFKVLPIAKEIVYKQIENGVLIVSSGGIIVDINPAAKNMLGADVEVGQNLEEVLKDRLKISFPLPAVHQRTEVSLNDSEKSLWLDVVIAPLYDRRSQLSGHLVMLHDISDRKVAEEALRHSEERYRLLAENATDLIWTANIDMKLTYISPSVRRLLGHTVEEAMALPMGEVYTPASVTAVIEVLKEEMALEQTGLADPMRSRMLEVELYRKDGSIVPVETNFSIIHDVAGKNVGTLCIARDISERKKADEAQHRLAVIVESSHDAILSRTLDGIITTWNKGAEMLYGYTAEEAIGRPVSILIPPEFADEGRQFLDKIKRGDAVRDYEAVRITKNGKRINVLLTVSPIKDMSGRIVGASAIAQNITELKRTAEVLKESEKKYRDLFENANEAIFVAQDARVVFTNPMLIRMFGYSAAELSAKLFIEFIYPDDRDMVIDRHRRRLVGEELPPVYSFRVVRRDGNVRWVELSAVVIEWEGKPATLNFLNDITERRQSERFQILSSEILSILNEVLALPEAVNRILSSIKRETGCDAVGIRLRKDEDFPYFVQDGFTKDFLLTENTLTVSDKNGGVCRDENGKPRLECTCGLVLSGKTDPSNPLFTPGGSAWTNDSPTLLGIPIEQDPRLHPRNRCIHAGFQSVALIPIRVNQEIVGLLQLNDRHKGYFTLEMIRFLEGIGASIGITLGRKRVEEALRESERKYRSLTEKMNDIVWIMGLDLRITYVSPSVFKALGFTPEEHMKRQIQDQLTPESLQTVIQTWTNELEQDGNEGLNPDRTAALELEYYRKDGSTVWMENVVSAIRDDQGKPLGLHGVSRDITERKRLEEVLRASEEKLRLTFESIADGIIIIDLAGKVVDVNEATVRIGGYENKSQLIGRDAFDLIAPKDRKLVMDDLQERQAGRPKERMEYSINPKDGKAFEGELTASTLRDENGNPIGYIAVVRDITERKRAEEDLKRSEKRYRTLFDDSVDAVLVSTVDGKILDCNDAMSTLTLYSRDELIGSNAVKLYANPMDRENFVREIQKTGAVKEYGVKWVKKDRSEVDVVMTLTARRDETGNIAGYQGIIRDVTERKKIEQMKTDFVSFISHQLRTPVAGLMAYIDNMLEGIVGELNGKQIEYLTEMRDVCARGNRLIADLLNVSRLERGILVANINLVDLRSVVDIAVKEYGQSIKEKGLSLNIQEANRGIVVLADSDKLVEVLKNVIHNAYKFTKAGSISIEISSEGNQGIVKIKDSGIGMTETMKKDLFKKEKVFGGAVAVGGGAGLGLYIAKGFMKLQGGDITVESTMGKGSTFIISLPRK